jgi:hypothetical protein
MYKKGCDKGNANGCNVLGVFFDNGIGVEKNTQEALKYLSKGCDLKSENSCKNYRIVKNRAK